MGAATLYHSLAEMVVDLQCGLAKGGLHTLIYNQHPCV